MKQIDYVFRQLRYSAVDPSASTEANSAWIRENYLNKGYEILRAEVVKTDANDVFVGLHFALYAPELATGYSGDMQDNKPKK